MPFCSQLTKILERLEPTNRQCEEALVPTVWSGGGTAGRSPEGTGGGRASAPGAKPRYSYGGAGTERDPSSRDGQWLVESRFDREQENRKQQAPRASP